MLRFPHRESSFFCLFFSESLACLRYPVGLAITFSVGSSSVSGGAL
ncbi:TPA: hypothetical protein U2I50_000246 [Providencia stuartii]|nr:hypothetical protein [Providencia stuartii]